ncbi:DUF4227 family protein [Paenibacillus sp. JX-17]|uniref:DUF4227 family protein n=1 Tax=Paenibacillus lacisoli TaxID=3064525 RepID=A0ABT9C792_9BACL|nr:DUF4227 family protein [Paenibacillus sp. JX-17]MDO7905133.1 DUF4227 family protein [Paenibacillus sp. JX-17]
MIIQVRKVMRWVRAFIVFMMMLYIAFFCFKWFAQWVTPVDHYRIPEGSAIKVFGEDGAAEGHKPRLAERLRFFYWYGE